MRLPGSGVVDKWRATGSLRAALELRRLERLPRYTATTTRILGPRLAVPDGPSFVFMYDEIFRRGIYAFSTDEREPLVVDAGANIGLSVLYFKRLNPAARVVAFEADPAVFGYLERNVKSAGLAGVQLRNEAVWTRAGQVEFTSEGADAGRIRPIAGLAPTRVRSVRLRDVLSEPVALLKLDIEGAELEVLQDCADALYSVERLFVEYHSFEGKPQLLPTLLEILRAAGFRFWMDSPVRADRPMLERPRYLGMDLQLNVFAWRDRP
jgi:FkbM family methyltransferase